MNQIMLWALTLTMAILMMVTAIFIARQRPAPTPAPEPVIVAPPVAIEPPVVVASVAPPPVQSKPVIIDEIKIDLSKIAGTLTFDSPDIIAPQGQLPRYPLDMTCYRKNASPALNWAKAPANTKSYLLALERRSKGEKASWSWIMFNIPATSSGTLGNIVNETITPEQGLFGTNSYGHQAYTGPCEPQGIFPYVLRLFALDIELPLKAGAGIGDILPVIDGHVIDAADIKTEHYLRM